MKQHNEKVAKKFNVLSVLHVGVLDVMFTKIMIFTITKKV